MGKIKEFFYFEKNQGKLAALFIAPAFIAVFAILIYPLVYSFIFSFSDTRLTNLGEWNFIAFGNYLEILKNPEFHNSLIVSGKFVMGTIIIKVILGTLGAVILKENFFGRGFTRAIVIIPWATPLIVTGIMWKWMLHGDVGVINFILKKIGIINNNIPFLSLKSFALPSIILADVWQNTPFFIIIILAGLQTIPDEIYEAARIDGAGGIKSFFYLTLPLVRTPIFIASILGTIFAINAFDLFYILTAGGPSNYTNVITLLNWIAAFKGFNLSYASAMSYLILIIGMIISIVYIIVLRRGEKE